MNGTPEERVQCSSGADCCVALHEKDLMQTTSDEFGRMDCRGKGAVQQRSGMLRCSERESFDLSDS